MRGASLIAFSILWTAACSDDSGTTTETDTVAALDTTVLDDVTESEDTAEPESEDTAEPEPEDTAEPEPEDTAEPEPEDAGEPDPEDVNEPEREDTGSEPACKSYDDSVQPIFNQHCVGCHNVPDADNQLDLTPGQSYQSLMTTISQADPALVFVVPGDPSASYLVTKLTNPTYGFLMPITGPGGGTPIRATQLQIIMDWIDADATLEPWNCP